MDGSVGELRVIATSVGSPVSSIDERGGERVCGPRTDVAR